jgi:glycosyltransferase involved in cell wall biosynthesis
MTLAETDLRRFRAMDAASASGLTVIVPAYNEEDGIAGVVEWIRESARPADVPCEVVVVDDGSADRTAELAEQAGACVIRHADNRGYGEALKTGIQHATHEWIAIIDADGSYPADQIPQLAVRLSQADMVVGARTKVGAAIPLVRRPAKAFLAWLASYLTDTRIPDLNSGLRLFRRNLALEFLRILPSGFSFTTTITMAALNNGYIVEYVPVDYLKRTGSSKINPFRDTLNFLILILRMTLLFRPLKIFIPLSLSFLCAALLTWLIGVIVFQRLFDNLILFEAELSVITLWIGMLADLINVRLRR